jgi:hypothetical protein
MKHMNIDNLVLKHIETRKKNTTNKWPWRQFVEL